ncbi:MAG TPA: hypothetical protein DCL86_13475 [Bacteroidales bacterium]|nr:hypothetical protein [Bacteroidales bacterium]
MVLKFIPNLMQKNQLAIVANSTAFFLLAYLFAFLLFQSFTVIAALLFDFTVEVNYTRIFFLVKRSEWSFDSVKTIFSSGPIISFIVSIAMIAIAVRFKEYNGLLKLFFLWAFIHCINLLLGPAFAGALLGEGFGHVLIWLFLPDTGKLLVTLISLFLLAIVGFSISGLFMLGANTYYNQLKPENVRRFLLNQAILPYIIGTAIIVLIRLPLEYYDVALLLTPIIILLTVLLNSTGRPTLFFDEVPKNIKINGSLVATAIIVLLIYRIGLSLPIRF